MSRRPGEETEGGKWVRGRPQQHSGAGRRAAQPCPAQVPQERHREGKESPPSLGLWESEVTWPTRGTQLYPRLKASGWLQCQPGAPPTVGVRGHTGRMAHREGLWANHTAANLKGRVFAARTWMGLARVSRKEARSLHLEQRGGIPPLARAALGWKGASQQPGLAGWLGGSLVEAPLSMSRPG